jgi:hypothetical protein
LVPPWPHHELLYVIDTLVCLLQNLNPSTIQHVPQFLQSELYVEDVAVMDAIAVTSVEGETLHLQDKVW